MKRILLIATLLVASVCMMSSCQKAAPGVNDAIYDLVQELKPTSVGEFLYHRGTVYHFDTWHGPDDNYRDTETDIINENRTRLVPLLGWPCLYFLNNWKSVLAFI